MTAKSIPSQVEEARRALVLDWITGQGGELRLAGYGYETMRKDLGLTQAQVDRALDALAQEGRVTVDRDIDRGVVARLAGAGETT